MEGNRKKAQTVPFDVARPDAFRQIRGDVTDRCDSDCWAAIQYLNWALEEIEKVDCKKAARHTRAAIAALGYGGLGDTS